MKDSLDDVMRRFAQFLNASWDAASAAATSMEQVDSAEFISDLGTGDWELLVETPFRSSRVWKPGALPTHRVVCRAAKEGAPMPRPTYDSMGWERSTS